MTDFRQSDRAVAIESVDQLVEQFHLAGKPSARWAIGTEYDGFRSPPTGAPVPNPGPAATPHPGPNGPWATKYHATVGAIRTIAPSVSTATRFRARSLQ